MEISSKRVEEMGFKAEKKGFFKQWQALTKKLNKENKKPTHEAAEIAYNTLILRNPNNA